MATPAARQSFEVLLARGQADRERLQRFRYHVLIEELGARSTDAERQAKVLHGTGGEAAEQLYLATQNQVIATVELKLGSLGDLPPELVRAYRLERFATFPAKAMSSTGPLIVSREWRDSAAAAVLLGAAYKLSRRHGCRFDFTSCPPALVRLFEQLGYRRHGENFLDVHDTYLVPMVLVMDDHRHLISVNSPFARLARGLDNPPDAAQWFTRTFPEAAGRIGPRLLDEERFWQYLTDRLHQTPMHGLPLLSGLEYEEARQFLAMAGVLRCRAGDVVVRQGDIGREMFVLLSGEVGVHFPRVEDGTEIARIGRGAVFGEIAYLADTPRTADVVAASDIEVLVLTQEIMRRAMRQMPEIAAKVLFNLSLVLCDRLGAANRLALQ